MNNLFMDTMDALFNETNQVELFKEYIKNACDYRTFTQLARKDFFDNALLLYTHTPELQNLYDYIPTEKKYTKRFIEKGVNKYFDDGINYTAPKEKGLYFIGETHFNPLTDEKFYWVKIDKARNIHDRLLSYNTHNPMLWRIDFSKDFDKETWYHEKLDEVAIAKCNHSEEWFLVDRTTYLRMCEEGFKFFE